MNKMYTLPIAFIVIGLLALCYGMMSHRAKDLRLPVSNGGYIAHDFVGTYDIALTMEQTAYPIAQTSKIPYTITNSSDMEQGYGLDYWLEKMVEGEWRRIPTKTDAVIALWIVLQSNASNTEYIYLDDFDYEFTAGDYRIVKPFFHTVQLAVAFTLV